MAGHISINMQNWIIVAITSIMMFLVIIFKDSWIGTILFYYLIASLLTGITCALNEITQRLRQ